MKKYILFILFIFLSLCGYSQEKELVFPEDYLGIYHGTLTTEGEDVINKTMIEFYFKKRDSLPGFEYKFIYDGLPRNYTLYVIDKEKGLFKLDQNNGIILSTKLVNNALHSIFEVQGNLLSSRFKFTENNLSFEILFCKIDDKTKTGSKKSRNLDAYNFPINKTQKATLTKVKIF